MAYSRSLLFITLSFLFIARSQAQDSLSIARANFTKLTNLTGTWMRTNAKPGASGLEKWELAGNQTLRGIGITMHGQDTAFIEKLNIIIKDNNIYYVADVPENKKLVYFKLTQVKDSSFIFENPAHDFPQKIVYTRLGNNDLKVVVSANDKAINYLFKKG